MPSLEKIHVTQKRLLQHWNVPRKDRRVQRFYEEVETIDEELPLRQRNFSTYRDFSHFFTKRKNN